MKGRVTDAAFNDVVEIQQYIANDNPVAARLVRTCIEEAVKRIFRFPLIGSEGKNHSVRVFPVRPFPYLVFYTVG